MRGLVAGAWVRSVPGASRIRRTTFIGCADRPTGLNVARALPRAPGLHALSGNRRRKDENDGPRLVVHCKRAAHDVYIGRPSKWGNRFVIGRDGTRDDVIARYEARLLERPSSSPRCPSSPARRSAAGARRAPATATCSRVSPTRNPADAPATGAFRDPG